jgi:hypothetical protein
VFARNILIVFLFFYRLISFYLKMLPVIQNVKSRMIG